MTDRTHASIGKPLKEHMERDAIHIAIAPVVAAGSLAPGERVGFLRESGMVVSPDAKEIIGIIDPYLTEVTRKGQTVWLFLFPNTVTSLRHEWMHPAFNTRETEVTVPRETAKERSEKWMRDFADGTDLSYDRLLRAADVWVDSGEYYTFGHDIDAHIPEEFWDHYETIRGKRVPANKRESFFSCSC
jgi:hypothetical protein